MVPSALRLIEWGANFRSRHLQMPYGDKALFLEGRDLSRNRRIPRLADHGGLRVGLPLRQARADRDPSGLVSTSARRWQVLGPWRTTWMNQKAIARLLP